MNELRLTLMVHQVAQTLRDAHCGHRNSQPLVYCNDEEEEEAEDFDEQPNGMERNGMGNNAAR